MNWEIAKTYVADHELPIIPICPSDHTGMDEKHIERCKSPGKAPVLFKWSERKRTTRGDVKTWKLQNPSYNIGLILGETDSWNLIGIDIDGEEGIKRWNELIEENGTSPDTWSFTTPSGGMRLLYSLPMGVKTKKSKDAVPLDGQHQEVAFICQGQQTVLPPSTIGNKSYAWAEDGAPWDGDIAQAPEWIMQRVQVSDEGFFGGTEFEPSEPVVADECVGLKDGDGRNDAIARQAGSYASLQNMTLDKLLMLCRADNETMAEPLDHVELETTVKSIWKKERRKRQDADIKAKAKEDVSEMALAEAFLKSKFKDGILFRYRNDRNGFFRTTGVKGPWERTTVKIMTDEVLEFLMENYTCLTANTKLTNKIVTWLQSGLAIKYKGDSGMKIENNNFLKTVYDADKICVENGVLNWRTGKLEKWTPNDHLFTTEISGKWTGEVDQTLLNDWEETLKSWIPDANSRKYLQEFMGYCLTPNCKRRAMTFLEGGGRNGKSMFIDIVSSVFANAVTNLDFDAANERFGLVNIVDKLLYVNNDVGSAFIKQTGAIKRIVNGETIAIERKGEDKFDYVPIGKFLLAANCLPKSSDKTDGWLSRLNIVTFPNQFEEDPHFHYVTMEKFKSEEGRAMLLYWMVQGLLRLEKNNRFTKSESMIESKTEYKADNDVVAAFAYSSLFTPYNEDELKKYSKTARGISNDKLYNLFTSYCESQGVKPLSARDFNTQLKAHMGNVERLKTKDRKTKTCRVTHKLNNNSELFDNPLLMAYKNTPNL